MNKNRRGGSRTLIMHRRTFFAGAGAYSLGPVAAFADPPAPSAAALNSSDYVEFGPEINAELETDRHESFRQLSAEALRSRRVARAGNRLTQAVASSDAGAAEALLSSNEEGASLLSAKAALDGFVARWPDDDESVEISHILAAERQVLEKPQKDGTPFNLTPALLAQLCANNSFVPLSRRRNSRVLFGIRGAAILGTAPTDWTESVTLGLATPDHVNDRCVLGVWNREIGAPERLRVFVGSTVPNELYMKKQFLGEENSNLAPTGLHRFVVAEHKGLLGAFRQDLEYPAHRIPYRIGEQPTLKDLYFTNKHTPSGWPALSRSVEIKKVWNNLHPARTASKEVQFSSAGCQVVRGSQKKRSATDQIAQGDWKAFRIAAGLPDPPDASKNGTQFDYLLVSAREALLTSRTPADQQHLLDRFRFGSLDEAHSGNIRKPFGGLPVTTFQTALVRACHAPGALGKLVASCAQREDFTIDGKFNAGTMRLAMCWQAINRDSIDGIVDGRMMRDLKLI